MSAKQEPAESSSRSTASLVIAGRVVLLLLASTAAVSAFVLSRSGEPLGSAASYACPMHPDVMSSTPGECGICRMALEPVRARSLGDASSTTALGSNAHEPTGRPSETVLGMAERRVFAWEVRAPAWVDAAGTVTAALYEHDLAGLKPGDHGRFFRGASPGVGLDVRLTADTPAPMDGSRSRVRVRFDQRTARHGGLLHALDDESIGWVLLAARPRELLTVPTGAILYSSQGPYLLVPASGGCGFDRRPVEVGRIYRGLAMIVSGLTDQQQVVTANAFFVDAEQRLHSLCDGGDPVTP